MENNPNRSISLEEFFDLYPKLTIKNEFSSPTDYFLKFFNIKNRFKRRKSSILMDNEQINKLVNIKKNSRVSSININPYSFLSLKNLGGNRNSLTNKDLKVNISNHNYALYKIMENEEIDKCIDLENEDLFLINKGIELQKRGLKRSNDVKKALESFFYKSELIERLSKNSIINNNQELENENDNKLKDKKNSNSINNNQYKINVLISKLAENVSFEKCEKNKFVIKMNDIGKDCYFLISGKLSILKPVEYKHIEITYENYFKYCLNLLQKNENELLKKVLEINWHFIKLYDEDNLLSVVKYYIQNKISIFSNISFSIYEKEKIEDLTLEKIEFLLNEYKIDFELFDLSKNKIISDINSIYNENKNKNIQPQINEYFRQIFKPSRQSQIILSPYNFLFEKNNNNNKNNQTKINDNKKINYVTLYKYEIFMLLEPGAFFGEMSLENETRKRNATIRTEEDCVLASLNFEQYENILMDDNKKIKILHVNFLCNNFFFYNISPKLFIKYYYPMFKFLNKKKNEIIYKQESPCNSLFLLKEGILKYEIFASIVDIHDLIDYLINALQDTKNLKLEKDYIKMLKDKYLINNNLITYKNNNIILREKITKKYKFELSISNAYEVMGIHEYFLNIGHICTCFVMSKNAKLFEIEKNSLNTLNKILTLLKRLFNIENIFIKQLQDKINTNFYEINDTNFFSDLKEESKLVNNNNINNIDNRININNSLNNKDEFILTKRFENYGHIEESIIKKDDAAQVKLENEKKNLKSLQEIKNYENNNSFESLTKLFDLKKIKNKKEKNLFKNKNNKYNCNNNNSIRNKKHNFDLNFNNSISVKSNRNNKDISLKNSYSFRLEKKIPKTIINIGNSYLSLPKLKRRLLSNRKNIEKNIINLSIVKNDFFNKRLKNGSQNILQNQNKSKEKIINNYNNKSDIIYNKNNILPNIKESPGLISFINKIKNNINLIKIKSSSERKTNHNKEININESEKKTNILAKYIKDYYQNRKIKGYSAFINPYNNSMIRHKLLLINNIISEKK